MLIVETCPNCGTDLQCLVYTTYPPIEAWQCPRCGWSYEHQEQLIRRPFQITENINKGET